MDIVRKGGGSAVQLNILSKWSMDMCLQKEIPGHLLCLKIIYMLQNILEHHLPSQAQSNNFTLFDWLEFFWNLILYFQSFIVKMSNLWLGRGCPSLCWASNHRGVGGHWSLRQCQKNHRFFMASPNQLWPNHVCVMLTEMWQ